MGKTEKRFIMLLAISEAKKSSEPLKCGAAIVRGEQILAAANNSSHQDNDASAHAEVNAIRKAGEKVGSKYLDGCTIYCTCEPCVMCLSAISFARIGTIVYGLTLREVFPKEKIIDIPLDAFLAKNPRKIAVVKNFMQEECGKLLG